MTTRISYVCPRCNHQASFDAAEKQPVYVVTCGKCSKPFAARVMTVRAKSGTKSKTSRQFSVRGQYLTGQEDVVNFTKPGAEDIEMRSGDLISINHYVNKKGKIGMVGLVENHKVNKFYKVNPAGCASVVILAILVGGLAAVWLS